MEKGGRPRYFVESRGGTGPRIYRPWVDDAWQLVYYFSRRPYWSVVDGKLVPTIRVPDGMLRAMLEPGTSIEALREQLARRGW